MLVDVNKLVDKCKQLKSWGEGEVWRKERDSFLCKVLITTDA